MPFPRAAYVALLCRVRPCNRRHATISGFGTSRATPRVKRRKASVPPAAPASRTFFMRSLTTCPMAGPCLLHRSASQRRMSFSHADAASPANAGKAFATRNISSRRLRRCSGPPPLFLPCPRSAASKPLRPSSLAAAGALAACRLSRKARRTLRRAPPHWRGVRVPAAVPKLAPGGLRALLRALLDPTVLRLLSGAGACAARAPALPQRGHYPARAQSLEYRPPGELVRTPRPLPVSARPSGFELRRQRSVLRFPHLLRMTGHPAHSKDIPRDGGCLTRRPCICKR